MEALLAAFDDEGDTSAAWAPSPPASVGVWPSRVTMTEMSALVEGT